MVVSDELFLSTSALYYIELARKLYEEGDIKVYVINNGHSGEVSVNAADGCQRELC